jgi:hypothetical protein
VVRKPVPLLMSFARELTPPKKTTIEPGTPSARPARVGFSRAFVKDARRLFPAPRITLSLRETLL